MSTPADRIRRALGFCYRRFWPQKIKDAIKDAAAALAELEADARIGRDWRDDSSLAKWFPSTARERDESREELRAVRAERDELRAKLAEYEQAPTVALLEWPAKSWPNLRLVSGAYATSGTSVELIARPTRKDGE